MMYSVGYQLMRGLNLFFRVVNMALVLYCVLSFFGRGTRLYAMLDRLFEPLRRPFMPITMYLARHGFPFDLSVIFVMIALNMVQGLLNQVLYMIMGIW
ncbi:MAG: YggT family protein [Candidatus Fimadaptatus sp.]|jgi:uncharacterized protein YggT (Ycf19 family)